MKEFTDLDLYYMNSGEHTTLYEKMGAHMVKRETRYSVPIFVSMLLMLGRYL